jgi:hypothetical protein
VARIAPTGGVLLGYFFGPRWAEVPNLVDVRTYLAVDAILVQRFGDLSLIQGEWPIIGQEHSWNPAAWPMPTFGRLVDALSPAVAWQVEYPDEDPNGVPRETRTSPEESMHLPCAGLLGAGAVELALTRLLRDR